MPAETKLFRCLKDNYGVLIHDPATGATAAIDAPEAAPVEAALKETGWKLTDILVTHHHADHTGGIAELKQKHKCRVVAPLAEAGKIPAVDETVREGDKVKVGNLVANVIETPGHTAGHITYWFHGDKLAFAGDTLFSIGCGRVIEGNPEMMWQSLLKLRGLRGTCGQRLVVRFDGLRELDVGQRIFVAAIDTRIARQVAQFFQRIPHLVHCAFDHAAAADREQRIAGEGDLVGVKPVSDVT